MKKTLRTLLTVPLAFTLAANAATVVWTNTSGGAWSTAANWSPNQVPGSGDSAFITNDGNYTVTLDSGTTVASIALGTSSGASTQTLAWTGGVLRDCVLTLSSRGVLSLSGTADKELANSTLNNGGTVIWSDPGALQARMVSSSLPPVLITNLAGGIFDVQNDAGFTFYNPGYGGTLTIRFHNAGILRKSGGVGVTSFAGEWQFENAGTVEVQQGALQFPNGFANTGAFDLAIGTAVNLDGGIFSFAPGSLKTGAGALLVDDGSVTLTGTVPSLSWTGGALADSDFTVASNAVLAIGGAADKTLLGNSTMNNAGTVTWAGTGALLARMVHTKPLVLITNLAGGLFELQNDAGFTYYDLYGGGVARFHNAGTLRKTGGPGTTSFDSHWQVVNTGSLTVQQGTIVFPGFQNDGNLVV